MAGNGSGTTVEQEIAKNPEIKDEELQKLQKWLSTQQHLPAISDRQLILFYHSCYFNMEQTKSCIETYYSIRTSAPEFFSNRDLHQPELQKALSVLNNVALPEKDPNGFAIIFHSLRDCEPSHYVFNDGVKLLAMAVDGVLQREGTLPGFVFLFDMKGVKLMHLTRVGLSALRKFFIYIQEGMPVRLKSIHVINVLPLMDQVLALVKPFMKKELYNMLLNNCPKWPVFVDHKEYYWTVLQGRKWFMFVLREWMCYFLPAIKQLHLHKGDLEPFYKHIPKRCLPKDFGGELPSIAELHEKHTASLNELKEYFKEEEKCRVDDSKRAKVKKSKCVADNNVPSFRNLSID